MTIDQNIKRLSTYALERHLISEDEKDYSINLLLDVLDLDEYEEPKDEYHNVNLEDTLKEILDYAYEKGLIKENTTTYRDLFDTKVMNCFVPRPTSVIHHFQDLYQESPKKATDWYYQFSKDSDYIRDYRVKKDLKWTVSTEYGKLEITINLSKPEKDPKAIAQARFLKQSSYPKCQLCKENMGYRGRVNHPARETLRIIPLNLSGDDFYLQYSPYSYFNEHCIVFNKEHIPMVVNDASLHHLVSFVEMFPHYMLGSNADLPIVGGSILTHDHYQGGNHIFPMFKAKTVFSYSFKGFEDVKAEYLKWPLSVIRITGKEDRILALADKILTKWRGYTDEESFIYASTDGVPHNSITPICHQTKDGLALDLALRNNITTKEYPLGVYHPHQEYWNIKKENIGLIEVMGLAILPSRLKNELSLVKESLLEGEDIAQIPEISKHADWAKKMVTKHPDFSNESADTILQEEVGLTFKNVLECAGVYKQDEKGLEGIHRFLSYVDQD